MQKHKGESGEARRDLIFRVFISSTFSDLIVERDVLQRLVFPRLREHCRMRNARFQAIDLRWGVSQEAALNQQTMNICVQELKRCQKMSPKPNFLIMLGNRYGWQPLPAQIPADEFEAILNMVSKAQRELFVSNRDVPLWRDGENVCRMGWYRRDDNAVPSEYVLQARTVDFPDNVSDDDRKRIQAEERQDWESVESDLQQLLTGAIDKLGWAREDERRSKYELSATHQEIMHGALNTNGNSGNHVFAYFRNINGLPADERAKQFRDMEEDGDSQKQLNMLKSNLKECLSEGNVLEYDVAWDEIVSRNADSAAIDIKALPEDLIRMCQQVEDDLKRTIDVEIDAFDSVQTTPREQDIHRAFAQERCADFVGRIDVLKQVENYLNDPENKKPLVIYGLSGSGKTALLAQAWTTLTDSDSNIARFIGATPGSADLRALLGSLCEQLGIKNPPTDMNELINVFRERLTRSREGKDGQTPPIIFLDALDQLNPTDNAHMLYWLPRELADGVKLVVSVLEPEVQVIDSESGKCFDIAKRIWPESMIQVGALQQDDGESLLRQWLKNVGRVLQSEQEQDILTKFARPDNGKPLYLKLAFEEARLWHSWEDKSAESSLNDSVEGILEDLLHRLEQSHNHGRLLVERALGGIAAAKNGLTEDEMIEILSLDKDLMGEYFRRNPDSPSVDKLPIIIWSRLYADLESYMSERRADGTSVMSFYHRQVGEAIVKRYLDDESRLDAHQRLGDYFASLDYWAESLEAQCERTKRLPPTPRPANIRKVVELPYHRLEAAKLGGKDDPKSPLWDAVADLLTDWQFLESKAEADPNYQPKETLVEQS